LKVDWTTLKTFAVDRNISLQWVDIGEAYSIVGLDGPFSLECTLIKALQMDEAADFEANFKAAGNRQIQPLDSSGAPVTSTLNNIAWTTAKDLIDRLDLPFIYYFTDNAYRVHVNFGATSFLCVIPWHISPSADQADFETYYKDRNAMPTFSATASATVENSTVQGSLVGTGAGSMNIPADTLIPGTRLKVVAWGVITTIVSPGPITMNLKLGDTVLNTLNGEPNWALSDRLWRFEALIVCRASGVSGSVFSQMIGGAALPYELKNTAPIVVDTTIDQQLDLTWQWDTEDAGNSITCTNLTLESAP
jgi:hypothetical protein